MKKFDDVMIRGWETAFNPDAKTQDGEGVVLVNKENGYIEVRDGRAPRTMHSAFIKRWLLDNDCLDGEWS